MEKTNSVSFKFVGMTDVSIKRILEEKNPAYALALYTAYFEIAQWQGTYRVYATTEFMMRRLQIGRSSFSRAKGILKKLELVADFQDKGANKKIKGHYIQINHLIREKNHHTEMPQGGKSHRVENDGTSALNSNTSTLNSNISTSENEIFTSSEELDYTEPTKETYKTKQKIFAGKGMKYTPPKKSTKQEKSISAMKSISYMKDKMMEMHGMQILDIPNKKREATLRKLVIVAGDNCDVRALIDDWIAGSGDWCEYSPENCFTTSNIEKYNNKDKKSKQKFL